MSIANEFLQSATKLLTTQSRKKEWYEEAEEEICAVCPKMTYQQRIGGCVTFMAIGFMLSLGSLTRLLQLIAGNPVPFATMYTLGNIISLCSTCFLYGPWTQAKKMFAPTRLIASGVYLFFVGLTLFLAFYPHKIFLRGLLLVISIVVQFLALCWYSISFIPFAREIVKKCCVNTCCIGLQETTKSSPASVRRNGRLGREGGPAHS